MLDSCNGTDINLKTEQFVNGSGDVDPRKELVQLKMLNFESKLFDVNYGYL